MAHWSQPSEQQELREQTRESRPDGSLDRRWFAAAFAVGVLLVAVLGFATDLFDGGPSDGDVSSAYRDGFDKGVAAAEAYWEDELIDRWWEGYKFGQASETSMAPIIVQAVRDGFSFESGYEAGLESDDIDIDRSYRDGWMNGYRNGWARVTGEAAGARFVPHPPGPGYASRVRWLDGGADP